MGHRRELQDREGDQPRRRGTTAETAVNSVNVIIEIIKFEQSAQDGQADAETKVNSSVIRDSVHIPSLGVAARVARHSLLHGAADEAIL
jgi:hypothetical protein